MLSSFFAIPAASPRDLPSFPTRRSSDLGGADVDEAVAFAESGRQATLAAGGVMEPVEFRERVEPAVQLIRSEEHTSELQSRVELVCRLLLEKKKKICRNE